MRRWLPPGIFLILDPGSHGKIRIQDKHPGSAALETINSFIFVLEGSRIADRGG